MARILHLLTLMKTRTVFFALLTGAILLGACLPIGNSAANLSQSTPTPTPFLPDFEVGAAPDVPVVNVQPAPEQAPPLPVQKGMLPANVEEFPAPTAFSDLALPNPVGRFVQPEGQVNILLLGSDQRPDDGGFRTDVILLLTLYPDGKKASLTSFPRDLYVYVPGWRMDRINGAFPRGGMEMMADTMEYNFGVRPDYYVLVNFWDFETVVDALGGINVQVAQALSDHRDGFGDYYVPAGSVAMDGETTLWYVRSRGTSSDFERTRREQEVLVALFDRLISLDAISKAPELYDQYKQTVTTDLGIADVLGLLPLAADIGAGEGEIAHYAIGADDVDPYTTSGGGSVLLPDLEAVLEILRQALNIAE
ncbi:MAG: LCP family protein [Anaerolineales bacterium]